MPVLSIVTADGTTYFATKPVAEHVSYQIATWTPNYVMPPAPYYVDCKISLADGDETVLLDSAEAQIKVRGNWATNYDNIKKILIEVKYREGAPIADDDAIVELCQESSASIVVTKAATDFGVHNTAAGIDLLRIPAFAFLYLLGNAEKNGYRGIE